MNEYKFSDIEIGLRESFEVKIDASKMDKFLDISNDTNPLHVDSNYAKKRASLIGWLMDYSPLHFIQH